MSTGPLQDQTEIGFIPPEEQERLARWLLEIMSDEAQWEAAFDQSATTLDALAKGIDDQD